MLSRKLNLILGLSMSLALMILDVSNESRAGGIDTFLREFSSAQAKLMSKYDQVRITAALTEVTHGNKRTYNVDMFQDGKLFKIVENTDSGDQAGQQEIIVANPPKSFVLMKTQEEKKLSLSFLGSPGKDYERSRDDVLREAMLLRASFNYLETPLREFLTMPETSIQGVKEEIVAGKSLMRVTVRIKAFTEQLRQRGVDHLEGWFRFEPRSYWALQSFDIKQLKKNQDVYLHIKETLDYGDPIDGMPILRSVQREVFNAKGYRGREDSACTFREILTPEQASQAELSPRRAGAAEFPSLGG